MVFGKAEIDSKIKGSKVLCVGAGGIGCELLKTLVLTGFEDIELVRGVSRGLEAIRGSARV
eukprot:724347-Prorocentrum_minimum.AAC.4